MSDDQNGITTPRADGWDQRDIERFEHGRWTPSLSRDLARRAMEAVFIDHPTLDLTGYREPTDLGEDYKHFRRDMLTDLGLACFVYCIDAISTSEKRDTINPANSSNRFSIELSARASIRGRRIARGYVIAAAAYSGLSMLRTLNGRGCNVLLPIEVGEHSHREYRLATECTKEAWAAEHGVDPAAVGEPPYEGLDAWELRTTEWGHSYWCRRKDGHWETNPWWPPENGRPPDGPVIPPPETPEETAALKEFREMEDRFERQRQSEGSQDSSESPASDPEDDFSTLETAINTLNRHYAAVNEGGEFRIFRTVRDPVFARDRLERIREVSFHQMYANRPVTFVINSKSEFKEVTKSASRWWMQDLRRRQYLNGVTFDPSGKETAGYWNLWKGWPLTPAPGDWSLIRDHIYNVICSGDERLFDYVIGWIARMFQHPDRLGEVALVLRGGKGCGKGTLGNLLGKICGQYGVHITNPKHLVGNFNGHLRNCFFVFADEATFGEDKAGDGVLKGLITEPSQMIEAKHENPVPVRNMSHVLMASNSDFIVPATTGERRYCVIDVSSDRTGDFAYFTKLNEQIADGGAAAMLHDLLQYDLTEFKHRKVPETSALDDQKAMNFDSLHRWWRSVLERGYIYRSRHGAPIFAGWRPFVTTQLLVESYQQYCATHRVARPSDETRIGKMMAAMYQGCRPGGAHPIREIDLPDRTLPVPIFAEMKERPTGYNLGTLEQAREAFCNKIGIAIQWEGGAAA